MSTKGDKMFSTRTNTKLFICEVRVDDIVVDVFAANNLQLLAEMARQWHTCGETFHYSRSTRI